MANRNGDTANAPGIIYAGADGVEGAPPKEQVVEARTRPDEIMEGLQEKQSP